MILSIIFHSEFKKENSFNLIKLRVAHLNFSSSSIFLDFQVTFFLSKSDEKEALCVFVNLLYVWHFKFNLNIPLRTSVSQVILGSEKFIKYLNKLYSSICCLCFQSDFFGD